MAVLARGVNIQGSGEAWIGEFRRYSSGPLVIESDRLPFVGVPASTSPEWFSLLRQFGYIVERTDDPRACSIYLDPAQFGHPRAVIDSIERGDQPLVRLARWPGRAHSALAITGDIDGLTIGDFVMRLLGS